ncbi:MAG: zinc ribbon domain-containing protein [Arcobacter sp.]|uniref:Zinc ribbon domain-containing protein n=1 Tax=Poseidonibacter parvus TaxID=1850254 RepID=A0A1P8KQF4_9BACT|nr:DUF6232 family protein [Poseidonibacter parvus]APW66796.1 hypothetical protein LPB137_13465 [Poseidonibacter parvus]MAC85286.1 zinc ribbon domain-containing protein [Arcobacter sp.]|tara:strand:- start:8337 stop:8819 length:483 start_codon:yes stop_codon:yes gene_type:complete
MECPFCKEDIKDGAIKCKHCGSMLEEINSQPVVKNTQNSNEEKIFYDEGYIKVTNTRFISGEQTFSLNNISSVTVGKSEGGISAMGWIIALVGLILVFVLPDWWKLAGVFLIMGGLGSKEDLHTVRITTNGGDQDALISKDKPYISKIVNSLNDAIVHRG